MIVDTLSHELDKIFNDLGTQLFFFNVPGDCAMVNRIPHRNNGYPQALHTYRINLSPFTKDFRVWGAPIETNLFIYGLPSGNFLTTLTV